MRVLTETTSLCSRCKSSVPARTLVDDDQVWLTKTCPAHGDERVLLSPDVEWYERTLAYKPVLRPPTGSHEAKRGCPYDCGPCDAHEQRLHLPVIPITSSCHLDCPICYTHNKNEGAYHMPEAELDAILGHLDVLHPEKRIINITGGEPTDHPDLPALLRRIKRAGFSRVTVSTHGLKLIKDDALLDALAETDARVILSFDSFNEETNRQMLGGPFAEPKLKALERLEQWDVTTTLLPVMAGGLNDHEIGDFLKLVLDKPFIQSLELHPLTFTGQSGASFDRQARYTTFDALADIERHTEGALRISDFVPAPTAHPLCYQVTYLLQLDDGRWLPFPRFMPPEVLRSLLADTLYLVPSLEVERALQDVINRLWAGDLQCDEDEEVLAVLKRLTRDLFAPGLDDDQRLRVAERSTKAIYLHSHMDEESFDTDRIRQCCVGMPNADGTSVPSCAYNILYRERDARFTAAPEAPLVQLGRGRFNPPAP